MLARVRDYVANSEDTTAWEFGVRVGRVAWTGGRVFFFFRPRTSHKGIGLTLQAVSVTSTGLRSMRMFMVMIMMSGDKKKKKQLKGEREKRESICRAHDTMLAALDDVFIKKFEGEVVGAVAFCLIHHIESVIDI